MKLISIQLDRFDHGLYDDSFQLALGFIDAWERVCVTVALSEAECGELIRYSDNVTHSGQFNKNETSNIAII